MTIHLVEEISLNSEPYEYYYGGVFYNTDTGMFHGDYTSGCSCSGPWDYLREDVGEGPYRCPDTKPMTRSEAISWFLKLSYDAYDSLNDSGYERFLSERAEKAYNLQSWKPKKVVK